MTEPSKKYEFTIPKGAVINSIQMNGDIVSVDYTVNHQLKEEPKEEQPEQICVICKEKYPCKLHSLKEPPKDQAWEERFDEIWKKQFVFYVQIPDDLKHFISNLLQEQKSKDVQVCLEEGKNLVKNLKQELLEAVEKHAEKMKGDFPLPTVQEEVVEDIKKLIEKA
jgi:hypothetical protein